MAVQAITATRLDGNTVVMLYTWTALANGDTGAPLETLDWGDLTAAFDGTFSVGGTIKMRGSNDGTNYWDLHDPGNTAISKTAGAVTAIVDTPRFIRPEVTAGDGSTALQCRVLARRGSR